MLVAAVCFGVLSSETATSRVAVTRTVRENFRSAYDILVRPRGAESTFEREHHVVDAGFLSDLYGGITMQQYRDIQALPGVSLAAPVANVGTFLVDESVFVPFPVSVHRSARAVFRVQTSWLVHRGLEQVPGQTSYLYWTDGKLYFETRDSQTGTEAIPGGRSRLDVCDGFDRGEAATNHQTPRFKLLHGKKIPIAGSTTSVANPFAASLRPIFSCSAKHVEISRIAHAGGINDRDAVAGINGLVRYGALVTFQIPVLVAGVDPAAETALVGLREAVRSGRYLREGEGLSAPFLDRATNTWERRVPVIASDRTFFDEAASLRIERLTVPSGGRLARLLASPRAYAVLTHAPGSTVGRAAVAPAAVWRDELRGFNSARIEISAAYWRASATGSTANRSGVIIPRTVAVDGGAWVTSSSAFDSDSAIAPPGSNDTAYRTLEQFDVTGDARRLDGHSVQLAPLPSLVGTFDPDRLHGFSPLSRVPLQTFFPPTVLGATRASRTALRDTAMGPTMNIAGYLSQPPLLLTTLQGALALENGDGDSYVTQSPNHPGRRYTLQAYEHANATAPISTVQVRVKDITGPNQLSLDRIKLVAEDIARTTGLTVNITAGSSPTLETIRLAAGKFGAPALLVDQGWSKEGADSGIDNALSSEDLGLSLLVLVVCGLFIASATAATVRRRRREIGILATLGWRSSSVFALVVGEAAAVGMIAGLTGCGLSAALAAAGSLQIPAGRLALIVPVTIALAILAASGPAWRAGSVAPLDALRPPVITARRSGRVRSSTAMALTNLLRVPVRSLMSLITLTIAVAALTAIVGITLAFRGGVAGTLLGQTVSVSVRGVDLICSVLIVFVGTVAVSDLLIASLRERAAELATLRVLGWSEWQIVELCAREGLAVGVLGSVFGAMLGISVVALLGAPGGPVLLAASLAASGGVSLTAIALMIPVIRLSRTNLLDALATE